MSSSHDEVCSLKSGPSTDRYMGPPTTAHTVFRLAKEDEVNRKRCRICSFKLVLPCRTYLNYFICGRTHAHGRPEVGRTEASICMERSTSSNESAHRLQCKGLAGTRGSTHAMRRLWCGRMESCNGIEIWHVVCGSRCSGCSSGAVLTCDNLLSTQASQQEFLRTRATLAPRRIGISRMPCPPPEQPTHTLAFFCNHAYFGIHALRTRDVSSLAPRLVPSTPRVFNCRSPSY